MRALSPGVRPSWADCWPDRPPDQPEPELGQDGSCRTAHAVSVQEHGPACPRHQRRLSLPYIAVNRSTSDWSPKGNEIFELLDRKLIRSNEFFQISLLNLFAANRDLNHFDKLVRLFPCSSENVKRKIILAAYAADCSSWIRERKEEYRTYGSWAKHALAIASERFHRTRDGFTSTDFGAIPHQGTSCWKRSPSR